MSYTPVTHTSPTVGAVNGVTSPAIDTTGADLLVAVVSSYAGGTAPTLTDSKSNTWVLAGTYTDGGLCRIQVYYCTGGATVGTGHTATLAGTGSYGMPGFSAWAAGAASILDQINGSHGPGTDLQPGSITPTTNGQLVVTAFSENVNGGGSSVAGGGGYTNLDIRAASSGNSIGMGSAYQIQTTATATNPTWTEGAPSNCAAMTVSFRASAASPTATVTEQNLPANHAGNITVHWVGIGTSLVNGSTTMTASGVAGWAVVSTTVVDGTHATVVLSCPAAATPPAGATGTLTLTEGVTGTVAATTTVGTPTLALSPTSGAVNGTPTLTLTGVNTLWASETLAGLFAESGGTGASIATPTVTTNTAATAVLTVGTATGTLTVTDASTGATATFTATAQAVYLLVISDSKYAPGTTYAYGSRTLADQLVDVLARMRPALSTVSLSNQAVGGDSIRDWSPAYTGTYGTHTQGVNYTNMIAAANAKPAGAIGIALFASMGSNDGSGGTDPDDFKEIHQHAMTDLAATGKIDYFAIAHTTYRNDGGGAGAAQDVRIQGFNARYDTLDGTTVGGVPVHVVDTKPYSDTKADPTNMLLSESGGTVQVHPAGLGGERWTAGIAAGIDRMLNPAAAGGVTGPRIIGG